MRHTSFAVLTTSMMLAAVVVGIPTGARSQTVVVTVAGNGYAPAYYPQPYPYYQPQVVYVQPSFYGGDYYPYGYYNGYYNGYYRGGPSILSSLPLIGSLLFGR
jgi:hypothetical protein